MMDIKVQAKLLDMEDGLVTMLEFDDNKYAIIEHNPKKQIIDTPIKKKKAPKNTALFLNWIDERENPVFTIGDFCKDYSYISKESAMEIITHQLNLGKLQQLEEYKFARK